MCRIYLHDRIELQLQTSWTSHLLSLRNFDNYIHSFKRFEIYFIYMFVIFRYNYISVFYCQLRRILFVTLEHDPIFLLREASDISSMLTKYSPHVGMGFPAQTLLHFLQLRKQSTLVAGKLLSRNWDWNSIV